MASPLAELLIVIGVDHEKAEKAIESMSEKVKENFKEMGKTVLEFLGVLGGVAEFASFFEHTIQAQVAVQRLSQEFHIGSEEISTFQIAAERVGGTAEGVNSTITSLGEKLSVLGTKMRGARMSGMALGMAMGYEGKQAEEMGVKIFKGMKAPEALAKITESMHGMEFGKAMKLGQMIGMDEGSVRLATKTKEEYDELIDRAKQFAMTQEETESAEKFEEAQKDMEAAMHKVGMEIIDHILPALQWMADKLAMASAAMAKHPQFAKLIVIGLTALGGAFILASINATISWVNINLAGAKHMYHIVAQLMGVEKAADKSAAAFIRSALAAVASWTKQAAISTARVIASWFGAGAAADKTSVSYAAAATASEASWTAQAAESEEAELVGAEFYAVDAAAASEVDAYKAAGAAASKSWLSQLGSAIKSGVAIAWNIMKVGAAWIWTGIQAMATGIKMAAAWVIGLGPVAWIIAGIVAVIAILVALEVKFHIFEAAWGWIKTAASDALNWIEDKLMAIGTLIKDYILAPFKVLGNLLHGDFKGALNVGLDVVKDWGKVLGFGGAKAPGLEPAFAGGGGGVSALMSSAPSRRTSTPTHHVTAHVTAHVTPRAPGGIQPAASPEGPHIPTDEEFNKAWEAHHVMRMNAAAAASSIHASAALPPSVVSQSTNSETTKKVDKHVTIGEITVHTQATDAKGVANAISGALENTVNQSDGAMS